MENKEPEKLSIDPDKIIPILLKYLMDSRSEIAYLKHFILLHTPEDAVARLNIDINTIDLGKSQKDVGINTVDLGKSQKDVGINTVDLGKSQKDVGINTVDLGKSQKDVGINTVDLGKSGNDVGINAVDLGKSEKDIGTNTLDLSASANEQLYPIFEKALLNAMEQYIKNEGRENSLYAFYSDFLDAVEEQNRAEERRKQAEKMIPLEETHSLPAQLGYDDATVSKLVAVISKYYSAHARKDMCEHFALELLYIYNSGMATRQELRSFTNLSEPGFAKHFPKLQKDGFIKRLSRKNDGLISKYELTDLAKHILLELFGVKKAF